MKDFTMPIICLAIGIWAAFTYPTQIQTFINEHKPKSTPAAAATMEAAPPQVAATQSTEAPKPPATVKPVKNNTTEDNRKQVAAASTAGKPMGPKATMVRGVAMPTDCTNTQPNLITYVEQHGDKSKPGYVSDADIPEYVCGWN